MTLKCLLKGCDWDKGLTHMRGGELVRTHTCLRGKCLATHTTRVE